MNLINEFNNENNQEIISNNADSNDNNNNDSTQKNEQNESPFSNNQSSTVQKILENISAQPIKREIFYSHNIDNLTKNAILQKNESIDENQNVNANFSSNFDNSTISHSNKEDILECPAFDKENSEMYSNDIHAKNIDIVINVSQLDIEQRIETTKIKHTESDLIDSDKRLHNDDITYLSGMISVIKNNKNTDNMLQDTSTDNKISKMTRKKKLIVVTIILLVLILLIGIVLMLIFVM